MRFFLLVLFWKYLIFTLCIECNCSVADGQLSSSVGGAGGGLFARSAKIQPNVEYKYGIH